VRNLSRLKKGLEPFGGSNGNYFHGGRKSKIIKKNQLVTD
jgi:hypothetical protein